jgi:glutamine synthetase
MNTLLENTKHLAKLGLPMEAQMGLITEINTHINGMRKATTEMTYQRKLANEITDTGEQAVAYCNKVKGDYFDIIREHADQLEALVDDTLWILPKYREMLFIR